MDEPIAINSASSHHRRAKRRRLPVSCDACRRRKSKCNRQYPCSACELHDDGLSCHYEQEQPLSTSAIRYEREIQLKLHSLKRTVLRFAEEEFTASRLTNDFVMGGTEAASAVVKSQPLPTETSVHRGATVWSTLVDGIQDISSVVSDAVTSSEDSAMMQPDIILNGTAPITIEEIMDSLLPREDSDRLVLAYFNAKFLAVPFIHTHQFQREYNIFWDDPTSVSFLWISILFSILSSGAMVMRSRNRNQPLGHCSESVPGNLLDTAAQCLVAGQYLAAKPLSVEALMMYIHSRNVQKRDSDSTLWALNGLAVRLAQRQGYHRDGAQLSYYISPFQAEMRRRVWYMAQSTDLLFSFQNGMHSAIIDECCDVDHPMNLTDDDFDESSVSLPPARSESDPIPILVYIYKSRLCRIMRRILHHCVSAGATPYTDVLTRNRELEEWHASIPPCLRNRPIRSTAFTDANFTIMHRLMLELLYLKSLCILHRPYLTIDSNDAMYNVSKKICRESAFRILDIQVELDRDTSPGGRMYDDRFIISNFTSHHFLMAAMAVCLDLSDSKDLQ